MAGAARESARLQPSGQTRERILSTAAALFAEHGYASTSVRMIARELGISDPAIHYHFPTKQALYEALLVRPAYGHLPLDRLPLTRATMVDQLVHLFGWWAARPDLGRMLLREQLASDPASIAFIHGDDETWHEAVAAPLTRLIGERGEDVAALLFDMLAGALWDALLSYGPNFPEIVTSDYYQLRLRAMIDLAIPGERLAAS
jgi:AcrR family transcriptional regulator